MTSDELKEFKEEVRNAPKEYLLDLKEKIEQEYRDNSHHIGLFENTKYLPTYKVLKECYLYWIVDSAKKLDIINAELKRLEYMK